MNFMQRVFVSMVRNAGKTLLLLCVIFILGIVISGTISVQQAVQNTEDNLRQNLPPVVSIGVDSEAHDQEVAATGEWQKVEEVSFSELAELGALPYVRDYDLSVCGQLFSEDLEWYSVDEEMMADFHQGRWKVIRLHGTSNLDLVHVEEGIFEITAGRSFIEEEIATLSHVAIVSEEFAHHNNLHVGANFTLYHIVWDMRFDDYPDSIRFADENIYYQRSYDFEVIGIFQSAAEFNTGNRWADIRMREEHLNRIYVPNQVTLTLGALKQFGTTFDAEEYGVLDYYASSITPHNVFILNDSGYIENFRTSAEVILPDFWTVLDVSDPFADIASSMETLGDIARFVLWTSIASSILILSLLITLLARDRRKEIGIYLALGESRRRIALQSIIEILAIAIVAISLSLLVGNVLAETISETMLRNDLVAAQNSNHAFIDMSGLEAMGFGASVTAVEEVSDSYNVTLDATTTVMFFTVALGTVIAATIVPMFYILRLNPQKILL